MKIQEFSFAKETTPEIKAELLQLVRQASSLDEIFDYWFLQKGNRISLSVMINDDGTLSRDSIAVCLDAADGAEVGVAYLLRSEVIQKYSEAVSFDSFIEARAHPFHLFEMHDEKFDEWMASLGFRDSYALMSRIGPRRAAMPLMVSFAMSGGGLVEARHIDLEHYSDEDYKEELDEEGVDFRNYFSLYASYVKNPTYRGSPRLHLDPIYCLKAN